MYIPFIGGTLSYEIGNSAYQSKCLAVGKHRYLIGWRSTGENPFYLTSVTV
jgi:hypothetical protein